MVSSAEDPRRGTIERFARAAESDERVVAAFLGGSFAAGTADEHSDLDIYAVIDDAVYEQFFRDREAFVHRWADPVFVDTTANFIGLGFDMVHFVNRDGVTGELAIGKPSSMLAMHGGPHEPLVDRAGLLEGVTFPLYEPSADDRQASVERATSWFWLDVISLAKALGRGRTADAMRYLSSMRDRLSTVVGEVRPEDDRERLREPLLPTYVPAGRDRILEAASSLMALHRETGSRTEIRGSREYPDDLARVAEVKLRRIAGT